MVCSVYVGRWTRVVVLASISVGCSLPPPVDQAYIAYVGRSSDDEHVLEVVNEELGAPRSEDWSYWAWPELMPLDASVHVEETNPLLGYVHNHVVYVRVGAPTQEWRGIVYRGEPGSLTPSHGGHPITGGRWLWRIFDGELVEPGSVTVGARVVMLSFVGGVLVRPEAGFDAFVRLEHDGAPCRATTNSPVTRALDFECDNGPVAGDAMRLEVLAGLETEQGSLVGPFEHAFTMRDGGYVFPRTTAPPIPPDLCIEGARYRELDCGR